MVPGIIGIMRASEKNECLDSVANCVNADSLTSALNSSDLSSNASEYSANIDDYYFWLIGATACGLLFAALATLSLWTLDDAVQRLKK
jgi:spore coat protein CotH